MKKKHVIPLLVLCVCLFGTFLLEVRGSEGVPIYKRMGEYFREATERKHMGPAASNEPLPLAEYCGEKIYQTDVEYCNKMNHLLDTGAADPQTMQETLTEILQNMVLLHEAERLGYTATQAEIDAMVENVKRTYSIPEGKEMIEQYCAGANISVDEYFAYLEEQAPRVIARQKLLNAIGQEFCEENGLEFTKSNPPEELIEAREAYIAELFAKEEENIIYYADIN